jgi:hypothetical protein
MNARTTALTLAALTLTLTLTTACEHRQTIHCKDGTLSSGTHTQGKCSHHGGTT